MQLVYAFMLVVLRNTYESASYKQSLQSQTKSFHAVLNIIILQLQHIKCE